MVNMLAAVEVLAAGPRNASVPLDEELRQNVATAGMHVLHDLVLTLAQVFLWPQWHCW